MDSDLPAFIGRGRVAMGSGERVRHLYLTLQLVGQDAGRTVATAQAAPIPTVDAEHRGRGYSSIMLRAMRDAVRRAGFRDLVAPVRPTFKHLEPHTPMGEYAARRRDDGLPWDPWLRTHVRAGGVISRACPASMTVSGSLAQWREWTGLAFEIDGPTEVPGALVPVHTVLAHDYAVYVEPNVWGTTAGSDFTFQAART